MSIGLRRHDSKRLDEWPWEVGGHSMNGHSSEPSCFYIYARTGKRKEDRHTVTGVVTFTHEGAPDKAETIEFFRKIAQKICDDHNAGLKA